MAGNALEVNITKPVAKEGRRKKPAVNKKIYRRHGRQSRGIVLIRHDLGGGWGYFG